MHSGVICPPIPNRRALIVVGAWIRCGDVDTAYMFFYLIDGSVSNEMNVNVTPAQQSPCPLALKTQALPRSKLLSKVTQNRS